VTWAAWAHWAILGGLLFSGTTVFQAGRQAFRSDLKAVGFVVLTELVMIFSSIYWLGMAALFLLVLTNAVATGTNVALQREHSRDVAE